VKVQNAPRKQFRPSILTALYVLLALFGFSACHTFEVGIEGTPTTEALATATVPPVTQTPAKVQPTATPTGATGVAGWETYASPDFGVSLAYPAHWGFVAEHGGEKYVGNDGFFLLDAIGNPTAMIDEVAADQAGHKLRPYGSQPSIEEMQIQGQEAKLILPSKDANMGGQAMLIVRYPQPVEVGGVTYQFFALYADQEHIRAIAETLRFATDSGSPGTAIFPGPAATSTPSLVIGPGNAGQVTQLARLGKGRAHGVAWSPDGQTLAVASLLDIDLYDAATLDLKQRIQDSGSAIYVAFSPDGKLLASAPGDDPGSVRLHDVETGELLRVLEPSPRTAHEVVFSPDGEMVAARIGLSDGVVRLWDVDTGQVVRDLPEAGMANSLAMSPDGQVVAAAGPFHGNVVDVWDVESGQKTLMLEHSANLRGVAFSPDGQMLASTGYDKVAVIWDLETGQVVQRLMGPVSEMLNVAFSPDGRWLASGANDGTLILWRVDTGEARLLPGHTAWISGLAFSPDGQTLASSSFDTTVSLSNLATGETRTIQGYTHFIDSIAVATGGRLLVTSAGVPVLWDVTRGKAGRLLGDTGSQWTADITPDGTLVATGGVDQGVNLWDGATGQFLHTLQGHRDMVRKLTFSDDGLLLASGSDDGTVIVWDVASGQPRQTWPGDRKHMFSLAFGPEGKRLAAGIGPDVTIWDVDSGQALATLQGYVSTAGRGYSSAASDLAFSPDGQLLATAGLDRDHSVQLWDVAGAQPLGRFQGPTWGVMSVAFSPDGRVLATDGPSYQVVLWDVATGRALAMLDGHTDLVTGLAFSPDGRTLTSGSYDGTARVWGVRKTVRPDGRTPTQMPLPPTPMPSPTRTPIATPTVRPEAIPSPAPTPAETPVNPQILTFEVTPTEVDPGDTVTLTWEASGDWATLCPSARFVLFSSDDCQQVPLSGETTFTIPLETAGFQFVNFLLSVQARDVSDPQVWQASVALKCHTTWFFSDEPQAGICPAEPLRSYAAAQRFEHGTMIWLEQLGRYVILDETLVHEQDVRKQVHFVHDPLDIIQDSSAEMDPPKGFYAPVSGFGLVWRGDVSNSPGYRETLGWALAPEFGYEAVFQCDDALPSGGRSWQTCYLKGPDDEIIVFPPLGGWNLLEEQDSE